MGLIQHDWCSSKRGEVWTQTCVEGQWHEGTAGRELSTSRGDGPETEPSLTALRWTKLWPPEL